MKNEPPRFIAEYEVSHHDVIRAEIIERQGKPVVTLSRWKRSPNGDKRSGQAFEFGAHRTEGVANILNSVLLSLRSDDQQAKS